MNHRVAIIGCGAVKVGKYPERTEAELASEAIRKALNEAGMSKDAIENVRPSARRILKSLRQDGDWAAVILMPGRTNGRYRLRT